MQGKSQPSDSSRSIIKSWYGDLGLRTKGSIMVLGPVGILSLLVWALVSFFYLYRGAQESSTQSLAIIAGVHEVEARMFESIATFYGAEFDEMENSRERHLLSRRELEQAYARVLELSGDNETQQVTWRLFVQKLQELQRLFDRAPEKESDFNSEPQKKNYSRLLVDIERVVTDARQLLQRFRAEESILAYQRLLILEERQDWVMLIGLLGVVASLCLMFVAWRMFSKGLLSQLDSLTVNLNEYKSGEPLSNFSYHHDELGRFAKAFKDVAGQVRQKDFEIQNFVYSVSHDLRSPLVNLEGFTKELETSIQDIRKKLEAKNSDPQKTSADIEKTVRVDIDPSMQFIRAAVKRLAGIVDGLLRLSRLGQLELRLEVVNLKDLLNEIVISLKNSLSESRVNFDDNLPETLISDRYSLEQIFGNLISNASKYLRPGVSGEITIGLSTANCDDFGNCFYVKDNGIGIPSAYHDKVFKMFERLTPSMAPGEGMGLAFVKRVVAKLDGRIWFESAPDEGTVFYVYLPISEADSLGVDLNHTTIQGGPLNC